MRTFLDILDSAQEVVPKKSDARLVMIAASTSRPNFMIMQPFLGYIQECEALNPKPKEGSFKGSWIVPLNGFPP